MSLDQLNGDCLTHVLGLCTLPEIGRLSSASVALRDDILGGLPDASTFFVAAVRDHPALQFMQHRFPDISTKRLVLQQRSLKSAAPPPGLPLSEYTFVVTIDRAKHVYEIESNGSRRTMWNGWELSDEKLAQIAPGCHVIPQMTFIGEGAATPDGKRIVFDLPETFLSNDFFVTEAQFNADSHNGTGQPGGATEPYNLNGYELTSHPSKYDAMDLRAGLAVCVTITDSSGRTVRVGPICHYLPCTGRFVPMEISLDESGGSCRHGPRPRNWFAAAGANIEPKVGEWIDGQRTIQPVFYEPAGTLRRRELELHLMDKDGREDNAHLGAEPGDDLAAMWRMAIAGWLKEGGIGL